MTFSDRLRAFGWVAIALIAGLVVIGLIKPWGLGIDFANFYDAGQKARAGEFGSLYDPFALIAGREPLSHMTFFSAPVTSYFYAPLAALSPHMALFVFKALGTAAMLLALVLLYREAKSLVGTSQNEEAIYFGLFAVAALFFQPFWTIYRVGGQTTPFVFLLLVLGNMAYVRGAFVWTALIFSLIVVIKPVFGPAAFLLFVLSSNRFRVTALLAAAIVGGLSFMLFGWELHREFLARILEENRVLLRPWMNSSPFSWIEPFFVAPEDYRGASELPAGVRLIETLARLGVGAALLWALRRQWLLATDPGLRRHLIYCTALLLVIVISPVIWAHYLAILFIPLAFLIARANWLPKGAQVIFGFATIMCFFQSLIVVRQLEKLFTFDTTGEILTIGLIKSLPAMLFILGMVWFHRSIAEALEEGFD
ncbi:MAG: DUF2029 domain-containing protein [Rhodobacteraceae bacterium]|nr:DUF2029 domain-containing protein [Paracoccaceae bacterium]